MDEKRLISCAKDGTVQIRSFDSFGTPKTFVVQGWRNANLTFCCLSQDDGLFFTCGKDGAVAMWKDKDIQIKGSDEIKKRSTNFKKIQSGEDKTKFYEEVI